MEHPEIRAALRTGYPTRVRETPVCPECGEETQTLYKDMLGNILGCCECIAEVDAWEETYGTCL